MKIFNFFLNVFFITVFLASCNRAKFDTENPPDPFSFALFSEVDDTFTFLQQILLIR